MTDTGYVLVGVVSLILVLLIAICFDITRIAGFLILKAYWRMVIAWGMK